MEASGLERQKQWEGWTRLIIDRIPLPYPVTVLVLTGILLAEQVMEYYLASGGLGGLLTTSMLSARLAIPLVFLYTMSMVKILRSTALKELADLQPAVHLSSADYGSYVHRMVGTSRGGQGAIGLASAAIVILLWGVVGLPLPVGANSYLPHNALLAVFVLASYVMFAWGCLTLVFATFRFGVSLGALARCPLVINVFDPENLLPFGRLSVLHCLSMAGVVLILLISLGPPVSTLAWSVVMLATLASLLALVLPLWGVHQQMADSQAVALEHIHKQFLQCQVGLLQPSEESEGQLQAIADRIETLTRLRKTVMGAPSWPFRDFGAILRALTAALSPLVYVVASVAIQTYLKTIIH